MIGFGDRDAFRLFRHIAEKIEKKTQKAASSSDKEICTGRQIVNYHQF
jgi:hypothetical protein